MLVYYVTESKRALRALFAKEEEAEENTICMWKIQMYMKGGGGDEEVEHAESNLTT